MRACRPAQCLARNNISRETSPHQSLRDSFSSRRSRLAAYCLPYMETCAPRSTTANCEILPRRAVCPHCADIYIQHKIRSEILHLAADLIHILTLKTIFVTFCFSPLMQFGICASSGKSTAHVPPPRVTLPCASPL